MQETIFYVITIYFTHLNIIFYAFYYLLFIDICKRIANNKINDAIFKNSRRKYLQNFLHSHAFLHKAKADYTDPVLFPLIGVHFCTSQKCIWIIKLTHIWYVLFLKESTHSYKKCNALFNPISTRKINQCYTCLYSHNR